MRRLVFFFFFLSYFVCYCEYWKLSVAWTIHTFAFMMMAIRFVLSLEASLGE